MACFGSPMSTIVAWPENARFSTSHCTGSVSWNSSTSTMRHRARIRVKRLRYAIEADAALRALSFPPMLLITLAENAIKHGIEPKRGPGQVTISAARDGDSLRVSVSDDGVGLQLGVGGGLGLANVRAQLDTLFDGRASFDLRNLPAGGVRAEMSVPVQGDAA